MLQMDLELGVFLDVLVRNRETKTQRFDFVFHGRREGDQLRFGKGKSSGFQDAILHYNPLLTPCLL